MGPPRASKKRKADRPPPPEDKRAPDPPGEAESLAPIGFPCRLDDVWYDYKAELAMLKRKLERIEAGHLADDADEIQWDEGYKTVYDFCALCRVDWRSKFDGRITTMVANFESDVKDCDFKMAFTHQATYYNLELRDRDMFEGHNWLRCQVARHYEEHAYNARYEQMKILKQMRRLRTASEASEGMEYFKDATKAKSEGRGVNPLTLGQNLKIADTIKKISVWVDPPEAVGAASKSRRG